MRGKGEKLLGLEVSEMDEEVSGEIYHVEGKQFRDIALG